MNKFFKRLALVLVIVMALVMIPVSLAAADPLPADADPAVWDTISLTRADGTSLVEGTDYTVTKGKYSHYAYSEPFTYNIYNVTTSDPIVISGGAAYKNSSLTYPLKSRITLGAGVTSVTLKDVTALGELSVTEGSNVDFTLACENYVDKILGTGLSTTITFGGEGSLTGEHIGGVDKYDADPATNVGCNIVINSGTFNITAGYKSAIGGGQYGNSGKITINGGNITAKSNYGAAIGGGQNGSATEIVITDGEINATGSFGAAIGGGQRGGAENISISGGTIEAKGSHVGAAIGGGQDGDVGTVEITDGDITVIARSIGIGGQDAKNTKNISISGGNIELKKLNSSSQEIPADAGMIGVANGSTDAVEISGGSFNVELPEDYLAEGTEIKKNEDGTYGVNEKIVVMVDSTGYKSLADAIANATPDANGTIIYEIYGKATVDSTGWIQVARADLTGLTKVEFVGKTSDAEICITGGLAILADQKYDIDVSFEALTLSKPNPTYGGDYGHSTNYFTTWLRNTNAAENTVTYTNCTFPNGACNNQYGKTVFDGCKFTNATSGKYNFWNYGGNTEIKNSTFTGVRGIKTYNEGTLAVAPTVKIENTKFDGLTEKAAIVTSKATDITLDKVSATDCGKGFFQKDIEGSSEDEKITITANGSAISGTFNITADKTTAAAKEEFNISAGTFTSEVSSDYLADGFEVKDNGNGTYGVKAMSVAKIGTVEYATLAEAITNAKDGDVIVVNAGEYNLNGSLTYTGKAFTIKAADGAKVSFDMSNAVALHGAKITFEGVTFDYKTNDNYIGIQHADTLVYNNCTINGQVFLYATNETFNVCKFNQTSAGAYNVWTYGAKNVKFNGCVFNCVGKSVLLYNEGANTGTDLTVTDTTFNASASVEGKAAIEIDTSLMGGQSKITVDKATADKTTGFANGSNSGNTLWNDKKQTADTNQNTTVVVDGKTVFEPANFIDLDLFIKWLANNGYNVDGANYISNINAVVDGKLTVKWSPVSGCYDTRAGHTCTVNGVKATGNTPKRVNSGLTQFQLFEGSNVAVTIKNVKFVYEPAAFTVCENSDWKGSFTAEQAPAGQLYFMTTGNVTVDSCDFEKVVFTTFNTKGTSIVNGCTFKVVYNSYAIKDIRGENVSVTGTTIENCGGGIMVSSVSSTGAVSNVTITGNTFKNVDAAGTAAADKVGTRAILQIASSGDYKSTAFVFSGNTATSCGPVIRQLNTTVAPVGSSLKYLTESPNSASGLYTSDSKVTGYVEDENGNVTISTAEGLFWFAKQVNSGNNFAGKTVKLANDIDLNNERWTPIGIYNDSKTHFKGTFDGQNHTVSGLNVVESGKKGVGFFGKAFTGTIKNLTVEGNITADGCDYVGGIVGHGYATITNCVFKGDITNNSGYQIGGIAGSGGFTITNCSVYGNIHGESWVGGIAGNVQDGGAYINCYVEGVISANSSYDGASAAGIAAIPLYKSQKINGCYSNTIVKCGDEVINAPIIGCYNGNNNITADTELFIHDNSWNKQKNPNDSYEVKERNTVIEGKTVSRDNNLIMLEDDLEYVEGDLSAVRIMAGSAVTQEQVDALAMAQIGDRKYTSLDTAIAAAKDGDTVKLLANLTETDAANAHIVYDLTGKTLDLNGFTYSHNNFAHVFEGTGGVIKNGKMVCDNGSYALFIGDEGETTSFTVDGVEMVGGINIYNASGVVLKNLTVNGTNYYAVWMDEGASATIESGTYNAGDVAVLGSGDKSELHVTGGTFCANEQKLVSANKNGVVAISGGSFTKEVLPEYCADRYIPTQNADGTYGVKEAMKGSKKNPYNLAELGKMTRGQYIEAQEALGGIMYVEIGDYIYDKNGVLGNGKRDDTTGQTEDRSVLNGYNSNGYLRENNDGANGKNIIFVGGSITSRVKGYTSIDNIGTSLLLAVPAYTNVTFEGTTFNNVMSFDYQLYTGPWSQLGELKFSGCTFNGLIVGAIAAQTLTFDGCEFKNYTNKISANNSNPTWIRPAYGNWSKGDNEGQGSDFKSLTTINFTGNKVTSTRPVKFERIAQWEMETKVTVTGNKFDIKSDGSSKNVGLYFGANAKFDLVVDNNKKTDGTAALYTAVYKAPNGTDYAGLPAGSTVKDSNGADVEVAGVIWKTTDALTLKTTTEAVKVGGVKFATLEEAFAAAKNGDTITLLSDVEMTEIIRVTDSKKITLALNGFNVTITATGKFIRVCNAELTITGNGTIKEQNPYFAPIIIKGGAEGSENYSVVNIKKGVTLEGWAGVMIDQTSGTANNYGMVLNVEGATLNGVNDTDGASGSGIYVNGVVEDAKITLTNTTVTGTGAGMYLAGNADTTINGGSVKGDATGIEIRAGKLTLNNCDVTGGNGEVTATANGNGTTVTNAALAISQHTTKKPIDVTINGGTFNGTAAVYQTDVQGTGSADVKIAVKSGTFNGTISGETDGTIAISGGKFKVKVDDKYFADKLACSATPNADGYYTVKDHPIISAGISIGEDMSFRIMVEEGYENGSLKYYYIGVNGRVEGEGTIGTDTQGNSIFRIYNVNPQRADLIYVIQYYDADGNAIGAPKEISVLTYFEGFYNMEAGKNEDVEARKTFIANFLEYCASAMERSYADFPKETLDGKTWQYRADAVRAMMTRLGLKVADYEFKGNLGRYYNDNAKGNITDRGIVFGSTFRAYYEISKDIIDSGCRVFRQGTDVTDKLVLENGAYRFYFELAPYEFKDSLTITIYNGTTKVCEYSSPLANTLKAISESTNVSASKLAKAAFNYFVALQNYEG